jgi:hypothetical protein
MPKWLIFTFCFGFLPGMALGIVALIQESHTWKRIGFCRARTRDEKEIIYKIQKERAPIQRKYAAIVIPLCAFIGIMLSKVMGASGFVVAISCFVFAFSLLLVFILGAFIMDGKIRQQS